ncbi:MAG: PQQ-dependent dehydrogenase, methanol/ethanol family [Acidobacteria bacterium]|nr:PQQ-dependent dehydrogenase, methanol/ethanol family [Acidobacteriota bacterium]MYK79972.1 PQQ-dependent dehydrogenase, methanol/ethanol family [Acidobacteriota bacterium]
MARFPPAPRDSVPALLRPLVDHPVRPRRRVLRQSPEAIRMARDGAMRMALLLTLLTAGLRSPAPGWAQGVTTSDLETAAGNTSEWLMYGRDYHAHRYVELDQITPDNVGNLDPVWVFATGGANRGLEATPLLHEGVIYLSADESRVFAVDARTGGKLWGYDPEIGVEVERVFCCGSINRGVALFGDLVYVGTMDARLVALDKDTGEVVWEVEVADWEHGYSITGAPLVVNGMVLTGMAGGEYGVRGFVKAYDAATGEHRWTTYTIPGPGEPGNETWPGDTWRNGGGPTWTTGVFDPELNLVYWNTGNAAPWNCQVRKGDNQWTAATIAIDADDGSIRWGFQYTPWDCWDYDAVSTPVLADVTLPGHGPVKALFHHDKNGFFYALDRTNGRFLYGDPIVPGINWAFGLDPETGRPDVNPDMVAQSGGPEVGPIIPSLEGAIDWQPLAYNPERQALYFMSNQWAMGYRFWAEDEFEPPTLGQWYLGADYQQYLTSENPGNFVGFDVVNREVLWRVVSPAPFWAGAVATSTGLVFTGDMRGYFMAIDGASGEVLWQFQTGSGIIGSPITYELDGVQYVAVPSGGIGGDMTFYYTEPKAGNLWVFALDGARPVREQAGTNLVTLPGGLPRVGEPGATLGGRVLPGYGFPPTEGQEPVRAPPPAAPPATPAGEEANPLLDDEAAIAAGERIYRSACVGCHLAGAGAGENVFRSRLTHRRFYEVVADGVEENNMPAFGELLTADEIWQVHAYLMSRDRP